MNNKKEIDFNVSKIEEKLKKILISRKDLNEKILTSKELGKYIEWLITTYGDNNSYSYSDLNIALCSNKMKEIATDIFENQSNISSKEKIKLIYDSQLEKNFFAPDTDISVSKQIKFMPSYWHTNEYFEFYYNMGKTDVKVYFKDEIVNLKSEDILLITTSTIHACDLVKENDNILFFMIRESTFEKVFWNQIPSDSLMSKFFKKFIDGEGTISYLHFNTLGDEKIKEILTNIYFEYFEDNTYKREMLNSLMTNFFIVLLRNHEKDVMLPRNKDFYWDNKFSAIINYIESNYANVTLDILKEKFFYSNKQISRIIYKYLGTSYNELILRLKMKKASLLLDYDNISIDQIANTVGYTTTSSFYRAFTKYYNQTPIEYKKNKGNR